MSRKQTDLLFSVVLLLVLAWMSWQAQQWDVRARLFPTAIGVPAMALALLQVGFAVRGLQSKATAPSASPLTVQPASSSDAVIAEAVEHAFGAESAVEEEESLPPQVVRRRTLEMVAWIVAITAAVVLLGFELGAMLLSLVFLRIRAHESWRLSVAVAVGTYLFFFVIFDRALGIPFPNGLIADALGLKALDHYLTDPVADFLLRR